MLCDSFVEMKPILKFGLDEDVRTAMVKCLQQQPRQCLQKRSIVWGVIWMPALASMKTISSDLYPFGQDNSRMGFI
jgi:hypothetical protein